APEARASADRYQPGEPLGFVKIPTYCASMSGHSGQLGDCGVGLLIGRARITFDSIDGGWRRRKFFRNSDPRPHAAPQSCPLFSVSRAAVFVCSSGPHLLIASTKIGF